jgi:putative endonuclease
MTRRGSGVGQYWEDVASRYLAARGIEILARSYACRCGEIDLVGRDGQAILLIEVRARRNSRFGAAVDSIDHRKQAKLLRAAGYFLMRHPEWSDAALRIDVVAIDGITSARPTIRWIKNALAGS